MACAAWGFSCTFALARWLTLLDSLVAQPRMPLSPLFSALLLWWSLGGCSWDNQLLSVVLCRIGSVCCCGCGYWRGSILVVMGLDAAVLWLKNCCALTEALVLSLQWVCWPQWVFSSASSSIIRCLRTLSPFPPTTVQGVSFLFLILKGVCKFFRGLSVSCPTASGVLSCYTWNHCPGLQCFVGACLVSIGSRQFLVTGPTTAFANKSAMKLVVAARTNSIFQVSLRHYDL